LFGVDGTVAVALGLADEKPPTPIRDVAQLLHIHMHQILGMRVLVAAHRLFVRRSTADNRLIRQATGTRSTVDGASPTSAAIRPARGAASSADEPPSARPVPVSPAVSGAGARTRSTMPASPSVRPAFRGRPGHLKPFRVPRDRPVLLDYELGQA
jgi:hypothetical protein